MQAFYGLDSKLESLRILNRLEIDIQEALCSQWQADLTTRPPDEPRNGFMTPDALKSQAPGCFGHPAPGLPWHSDRDGGDNTGPTMFSTVWGRV